MTMLDFLNALVSSKLFWLIALPSIVLYCYLKFVKFTYWKRHGLPYEEPTFVFGNIGRSCLGLTSIGKLLFKLHHIAQDSKKKSFQVKT